VGDENSPENGEGEREAGNSGLRVVDDNISLAECEATGDVVEIVSLEYGRTRADDKIADMVLVKVVVDEGIAEDIEVLNDGSGVLACPEGMLDAVTDSTFEVASICAGVENGLWFEDTEVDGEATEDMALVEDLASTEIETTSEADRLIRV
jgi:hypothetical protein